MKKGKIALALGGVLIGLANGLFGAGGGILAVPILQKAGLEKKQAHANAVAVILPITVLSATLYLIKGNVSVSDALPYLPAGVVGALVGTYCMKKISALWLKKIFGLFVIYAGVRLLLK